MPLTPALRPIPLDQLLRRVAHEWRARERIFDLPASRFWRRQSDVDLSTDFLGRVASSPLGPAAGPQSQMSQNLVLSWLGGSRIFELKTVQVDDALAIGRPCIDAEGLTYNTELSQELRISEAVDEYIKASMMIEILRSWEPIFPHIGDDAGSHVFDLSVGYSLQSVRSPKVAHFIQAMTDATTVVDRLRQDIPDEFAFARDFDFTTAVSSTATLSTFHGCLPLEISDVVHHLMQEHELDVVVKLNPTLLGFHRVEHILHDILHYFDVTVDPHCFPADLQFHHATELIGSLASFAMASHRRFGLKLTNTMVVDNIRARLADDPVYLSGPPLHVLATTLLDDLINDMPGRFEIAGHEGSVQLSFSGGVSAANISDTLGMGVKSVTVCSDLLRPGGYGRLQPMLRALADGMRAASVTSLNGWHQLRWSSSRAAGFRGPAEEHMTELLTGPKTTFYEAAVNLSPLRTVDHVLDMWGCVACNNCVTVCPNDAVFAVRTPPGADLRGRQQYIVLADLCNDCGNCATFCPETGDPARIKPRVHFDSRSFAADTGARFHVTSTDGVLGVEAAGASDLDAARLRAVLLSTNDSPPVIGMSERRRPRINRHRLLERIDELARVGAIEGTPGCSRLALTDDDRRGRDLVTTWMRDLGMSVVIDGVGNVVGTMAWPDPTPPVMTGSHIDTVATGGRYDGNLGVLAGLEVIETVLQHDLKLARPLSVAFFTNEEGARFAPDMLGSLVYTGGMVLEDALAVRGIDGAVLGAELARVGYQGAARCPARPPYAFLELHIEQGPVLERVGRRIGAVTGVQGISWTEVTIVGQSNHAGTTPMDMRRDPVVVAARLVTFVHELALEMGGSQVATVGLIDVTPNLVNVVPARVKLTVDLRNTDSRLLRDAEDRFSAHLASIAESGEFVVHTQQLARFDPVEFDPDIVDLVVSVAAEHGHDALRMPSGAGHDAQMLAAVAPAGMIFVPSAQGLSHNPAEHTDAADIELGANILLDVMLALATEQHRQP